jgi:sarcosine oxidase subunit delta
MFLLHCPHCGDTRAEEDFAYAGEAYIARPATPETVDDATWGDYVFMRKNTKGWHWEQWQHTAGCRKVLVVRRNTASYEVGGSWTLADAKPLFLAEAAAQAAIQPASQLICNASPTSQEGAR